MAPPVHRSPSLWPILTSAAAVVLLGGCGYKGPLYLPPPATDTPAQAAAVKQSEAREYKAQEQAEELGVRQGIPTRPVPSSLGPAAEPLPALRDIRAK